MKETENINKFEQQRQQKLQQIRDMGIDPYGGRFEDVESADQIKGRFKEDDDSQRARGAGRIVL
ncbi:MAG: lysine--tRNA ligase, partial [Planctomycetota bacterium]